MSRFATSHVAARVRALCIAASLVSLVTAAHADPLSGPGPLADQHAPAGVMFDHMHKAGEIMVEFRYAGSFAGGSILHGEKSASDQEPPCRSEHARRHLILLHDAGAALRPQFGAKLVGIGAAVRADLHQVERAASAA